MRVTPFDRWFQCLLYGPRRHPTLQVQNRSRLVVGAASPRAAKWLLADNSAGRLVVDVKVAGGKAKYFADPFDDCPVGREHRTGERVRRRGVRLLQRSLEIAVVVGVHSEDRAEVLGAEHLVRGIGALDECWGDEPALAVVGGAAGQHRARG